MHEHPLDERRDDLALLSAVRAALKVDLKRKLELPSSGEALDSRPSPTAGIGRMPKLELRH